MRDYIRHNLKDYDAIIKYNRNVIPKRIKKGSIRVIIRAPLLTEIIVSDLTLFFCSYMQSRHKY